MINFSEILENSKFDLCLKNIKLNKKQIIYGINSVGVGCLLSQTDGGIYVAKNLISSGKIATILTALGKRVKFLTSPFENNLGLIDDNLKFEFYSIVYEFLTKKIDFIIATTDSIFQKIPNKKQLLNSILKISKNDNISIDDFIKNLIKLGFVRTDFISKKGQFVVKGDTIQIFPINFDNFIRVEFFDTVIEKISEISIDTRRFIKTFDDFDLVNNVNQKNCESSLLNLCDNIFYDEPKQLEDLILGFVWSDNFIEKEKVLKSMAKSQTAFANINSKTFFNYEEVINLKANNNKKYLYNFKELLSDIIYYQKNNQKLYFFCKNKTNVKILENFLENNFIFTKNVDGKPSNIFISKDFLPYGVNFVDSKVILFGTYDLFKKESIAFKNKKSIVFMPKINDYVVHETHGIGKCIGLEKLNLTGFEKDYFIIEYFGGDKFYLPSEQADTLSAYYTSNEEPKLNKLGGIEFSKIKEKVYKNVKKLAFDLLELYAKREKCKGTIYAKDDYLMEQFENSFPYDETPDQLQAISEIKADMESPKIMDRLICGDVGFGKTEVALRAIYKAVLSGKQVAFLCPTTILSQQHYQTCQKRFNGFMVKTARFNRLMSKSEERSVLSELESGKINVICGTHKLLSPKVKFKDLGLLILDEEQRFGVEDKEKIKHLKNNIDVLALSATPIPRTLHMSLTNIRDISVIETPPLERQPIQTFVTEFDYDLVKRACKQELTRDGQVLIVYNKIDTIYEFAKNIIDLLPTAKIGVAHGKLSKKSLEDSILKLYNGEYNILVSTTLIENGIDLPSANTLIVVDADKLGLSQLYQIRGRIGRSNKIAYAYFTFKPDKQLTSTAYQRLSTLMENTSLGSGFKIAMADLDIRGAGNVLGREQHGNMLKVGYNLYYKLLNIAIKEIKGEKEIANREVKLDIDLDAYIPETYISSEFERINIIGEISNIKNEKQKQELSENLIAVYGKIPEEVENLLTIGLIKNLAKKIGVKRILINQNTNHIYFYENKDIILSEFISIKEKIIELLNFLTQ